MEKLLQNIKQFIKFDFKTITIIVLSFIIYFLTQKPNNIEYVEVPTIVEVEVPGKQGEIRIDSIPVPYAVKNPINDELVAKYEKANDSIKKLLFIMSIAEKEYNISFKDSIQNIDVYSKLKNGELVNQTVTYDIFPRTETVETIVKVPVPKYNKILVGGELGIPINNNNKPVGKFNLMFQNKKDNILSLSYDTNGTGWVGYNISF